MSKILIIGGGVSGLSAGIYSCLSGHETILCEKHFVPGGNLTGWQRGDYHIDNCIHWLTGTNPATDTYRMWEDLGALGEGVEVYQADTLYTCELGGERLSLYRDLDATEREMLSLSPEDSRRIRSFINAVKVMQSLSGIGGKEHNHAISAATIAHLPALIKYYRLTVNELAKSFKHPLIRYFISSFWGEDFGALALLTVFATFTADNGGIPKGSSVAMANRMAERFESLGGRLLLKKEAVKINHEGRTATSAVFSDGEVIEADYIVLASDPAIAFDKLLSLPMPKKLREQYESAHMKRFSSYQCAFSCEEAKLPFSGDFIFEVPNKYRPLVGTDRLVLREFSHEPSFAPKGENVIQTLTFCYEDGAKDFIDLRKTDRVAYKKRKEKISAVFSRIITRKVPSLAGKLKCIDVWTPATYKRYTGAEVGSYMSFVLPSKLLPMPLSARIDSLKNVILATQWLHAPGGLPIAAARGKAAIEEILKLERKLTKKQKLVTAKG